MSENKSVEKKPLCKENLTQKEEKHYVILMETNFDHGQSWYYFLRLEGNEDALKKLEKDLESLDWDDNEDCEFAIDLHHPVSEQCAHDMIRVDLNSYSFHRKFDGVLDPIDFGFKEKESNEKKMKRVIKMLGMGDIEDFAHDEDEPDPTPSQQGSSSSSSSSSEESAPSSPSPPERHLKKKGKVPFAALKRIQAEKKK